jgi:hypothetical protein
MIDNEKLHQFIQGRDRVLVLAPRRSGKTRFFQEYFEKAMNKRILYVSLTTKQSKDMDHLLTQFIAGRDTTNGGGTTCVVTWSQYELDEEIDFEVFDLVCIDEPLFMCPLVLDNIIRGHKKPIIAISTNIPEATSASFFDGFDMINPALKTTL